MKSFASRTRKSRMGCATVSKYFAIVIKLDSSAVLKSCKKSVSARLGQDSPCLLGKQIKVYFASG